MTLGAKLPLKQIRTLELERPMIAGLPSHLSAGSGLTCEGDNLRVVADDGLDMGTFSRNPQEPGRLTRLLDRPELPSDEKERKKVKPDLESATVVGDNWLALGSGSKETRMKGVCLHGGEAAREFDLQPLYQHLSGFFEELNIEGVAPLTDEGVLRLAQRGNGSEGKSYIIDLDLERAVYQAETGGSWGPELILNVHPVRLGSLPGSAGPVPLTLTDLTPLDGSRLLFTAAAEDTQNAYDDGAIAGSAIGVMDASGTVLQLRPVDQNVKLEGICRTPSGEVLVVTDGDNPNNPAILFSVE